MAETLVVHEIYLSLQGESTWAGLPCVFIRLTACNLRCSYCDTAYAFAGGKAMLPEEVLADVRRLAEPYENTGWSPAGAPVRLPLVELTGGEPLLQKTALPLMKSLCDERFTVLLETSGALDIAAVDPRVHRIMDLKCPSSGEAARNRWENIPLLRPADEIKFVVGTGEDYEWMRGQIRNYDLACKCPLLVSWVHPLDLSQQHASLKTVPASQHPISRRELAERIVADALPVRFQAQLHKIIWPVELRGV